MGYLGNSQRNKWCCFCKHWYDPTNSALKPKTGRDLFDIDPKVKCKCMKINLFTIALHTCSKFEKKM